ncbi:MAG: MMPL family transporter, partial [Candidatus Diapherotrites archaeon]|nr:MMPL family transporter [Candidatus Diapherotrites archaeon]
ESAMIVIESNPTHSNSNEPRDVREPEVVKYVYLLSQMVKQTDDVTGVSSASTLMKQMNNNRLPKTISKINLFIEFNPALNQYISKDNLMSLVKIELADNYDQDVIIENLENAINSVPKPPGLDVVLAGETLTDPIVNQELGPDMMKTSRFSLIGIILILLLLFRSPRYSFIPLLTIAFGVLLAFGYIGFIGMGINSATSGVISMIMGIGIDFGIQIVMRFKQELKKFNQEKAMEITMVKVFVPMATTTLAALIGFKAMSMGQLTMLADMGIIMSYGVAACFFSAVTIVPAFLVLSERFNSKLIKKMRFLGSIKTSIKNRL